jgi:hypothetical protein
MESMFSSWKFWMLLPFSVVAYVAIVAVVLFVLLALYASRKEMIDKVVKVLVPVGLLIAVVVMALTLTAMYVEVKGHGAKIAKTAKAVDKNSSILESRIKVNSIDIVTLKKEAKEIKSLLVE